MSGSVDSLSKRVEAAYQKATPRRQKPMMHLPIIYLDPEYYTHENNIDSYRDFSGCEEQNRQVRQMAEALGIAPQVLVMGPNEDGIDE